MTQQGPSRNRLIAFGAAMAIPLAAVALYFAFFEQPAPRAPAGASRPAPPETPTGPPSGLGQPALPPDHPPIGGQPGGPQGPSGMSGPAGHPQVAAGRPVRIPETVKGKWQAVKLRVEQKTGGKAAQIYTVPLGGRLDIPGSQLRLHVGDFVPALQVSGNEITSASNAPTNPAVLVTVTEGGKESFRGWLFSQFPEMQPFEHPKYRITLVEGISKS